MSVGAHGKLILLGEHAAVYGTPALASPCGLVLRAQLQEHPRLVVPGLGVDCRWDDPRDTVAIPVRIMQAFGVTDLPGIQIDGSLLPGVGLGYSAAYSLVICRLLAQEGFLPHDKVMDAAAAMENRFHGGASGIDLATAAASGPLRFQKRSDGLTIEPIMARGNWHFVVAVFPVEQTTRDLVAMVRSRYDSEPEAATFVRHLGELADQGMAAMVAGKQRLFGTIMNRVQVLLAWLGVSNTSLDQAVLAACGAGALGAKLSGAGGGGALLALVDDDHRQSVLDTLQALTPLTCFELHLTDIK